MTSIHQCVSILNSQIQESNKSIIINQYYLPYIEQFESSKGNLFDSGNILHIEREKNVNSAMKEHLQRSRMKKATLFSFQRNCGVRLTQQFHFNTCTLGNGAFTSKVMLRSFGV